MGIFFQSLAVLSCLVVAVLLVAAIRIAIHPVRPPSKPSPTGWFDAVSTYRQAYDAAIAGRLEEASRLLETIPGGGGISARFLRALLHESRCGASTPPTEKFRHEMEAILADTPDYLMALVGLVWYSRHHDLQREVSAVMPFVASTSAAATKMLSVVGIQLQMVRQASPGGPLASLLDQMLSPPSNGDHTKDKSPDSKSPPGHVLGGIGDDGELPSEPE